jgi:hypothetical protein
MRRIMATLAVMALLLAAMAAPAFAANPNSNCVGEAASVLNQPHDPDFPPGSGGETVSEAAREGTISETASTNCLER